MKEWLDKNYRTVMLIGMAVEIFLIGWLVVLDTWKFCMDGNGN